MADEHLFDREKAFLERLEALVSEAGENPVSERELSGVLLQYKRLLGQAQKLVVVGDRMQQELNLVNAKLTASEEKYRNIFDCAAEGIFQATPEGRLISANPALAKILGRATPEALIDEDGCALFGGGRLVTILEEFCQCEAIQSAFSLALPKGKEVWLEIRAVPVRDESGAVVRIDGLVSDVTKRKELEQKLYRYATVDALTGLHNRRHYLEMVEVELARSARHDIPLTIMMLDIDHFKAINDGFGHDVGDLVLKQFAATVSGNLRYEDVVGRIGGEEFSVLMPHVGIEGAKTAANNLRKAVEESTVYVEDALIAFTVSIGVVERSAAFPTVSAMLKGADEALYAAKRNGRNRVETAGPEVG